MLLVGDRAQAELYIEKLPGKKLVINSLSLIGGLIDSDVTYILYSNKLDETIFSYNIIQICDKIDNRTSFAKKYKDKIKILKPFSIDELVHYIQSNTNLITEEAFDLAKTCETFSRVKNEVIKYNASNASYSEFKNCIYSQKDIVFELVNNVMTRKELENYEDVNPMSFLSVLANTAKQVLQVQNCGGNYKQTGINPYIISKLPCGYFSNAELMKIIQVCNSIDLNIKKGLMDASLAIPICYLNIKEVAYGTY